MNDTDTPPQSLTYEIDTYLQAMQYRHLPLPLQETSRQFHDLAARTAQQTTSVHLRDALHHLLLAKDAAVRATLESQRVIESYGEAGQIQE